MSEREEYTPDAEDVEETYVAYEERFSAEADPRGNYRRWLAAHDREVREQVAQDIEQHYLGPDSGRRFDGRDAPDAAEREAFDEGLQFAARIARGEGSE